MSKVWKNISRFFIKLLNFSYNNEWFKTYIFFAGILYIILLILFNNTTLFKVWNLVYALFTSMYISGWYYDTYKSNKRIEYLENGQKEINKEFLREDLASLMHRIWADEIISEDYPTDSELKKARKLYFSLSKGDKEVNKDKADKIISLLENYKLL